MPESESDFPHGSQINESMFVGERQYVSRSFGKEKYTTRLQIGDREVPVFVRKTGRTFIFPSLQKGETPADRLYQNWVALRKAGVRVPDDFWILDDDTVVMADVTADGSGVYGKHDDPETGPEVSGPGLEYLKRKPLPTDLLLKDIDMQHVQAAADIEMDKATRAGIILPRDGALDLVVGPGGEWYVASLDLETVNTIDPDLDPIRPLEKANRHYVNVFLGQLGRFKDTLV